MIDAKFITDHNFNPNPRVNCSQKNIPTGYCAPSSVITYSCKANYLFEDQWKVISQNKMIDLSSKIVFEDKSYCQAGGNWTKMRICMPSKIIFVKNKDFTMGINK